MMVEIEDIEGEKKIIGIHSIVLIKKDKQRESEIDDEPLAVLVIAGNEKDIILKQSMVSFKRVLVGGGATIIQG